MRRKRETRSSRLGNAARIEHRDPHEHPEQRVLAAHLAPVEQPQQEERAHEHHEQHEHVGARREPDRRELRVDRDHASALRSRAGPREVAHDHDEQPEVVEHEAERARRRLARAARTDARRHLRHAVPGEAREQQRLGGVHELHRVRAREVVQHPRVETTETRRRVGELLLRQPVDRPAEHAHREAPQRADLVLDDAVAEAAADHEVRAVVEAGVERGELARVVLTVGVELERAVVAGAACVAEARPAARRRCRG